jgi:hypothetical protein
MPIVIELILSSSLPEPHMSVIIEALVDIIIDQIHVLRNK